MQTRDCDFSPMKETVKKELGDIHEKIDRVIETLDDEEHCLLKDFMQIRKAITHVSSLAASFYLQCYLSPFTDMIPELSIAVQRMSRRKHGALIAICRKESLDPWVQRGTPIGAAMTRSLIESIFYPGSPLHDGAVILKGNQIISAANILPLTQQTTTYTNLGTRHRAAIGLSEKTDALVIVVSEETGQTSFALGGRLYPVQLG